MSGIARRYDVAVEAIRAANGLQSNTIYIGQILLIPNSLGYPTPTPEPNLDATERINFAPGTTSATVNGTVTDPAHRRYLVRAQAGQTMNVTLTSAQPTTSFSVVGVSGGQTLKGLGDGGNSWSGVLPQTQDYLIEIVTLEFSSTSYTLTVEIPAQSPPATNPAERIQFAPGGTSATVEGTVIYPTRNQYLVRAQGGQTMRAELVSDYGIANFSVQGVSDGQPLKRLENSDTVWSGTLPGTQDYLIQIATLEGSSTNYSLYVERHARNRYRHATAHSVCTGATSATVTGHTSAIEPARYVLRANGGQQMNVTLNVDNANAYITVLQPNGNNLAGADGSVHNWTGWLPVSGDYIIEVLNPALVSPTFI
ncbi:MAG: LysM peptidoglycan-binding domain-containing protein [Caldilineaceae bacterium]